MDALDHPAVGRVGVGWRCAAILAATADMGDETEIVGELTRAVVIVALVQAQVHSALENEQDDHLKPNSLSGSLNSRVS